MERKQSSNEDDNENEKSLKIMEKKTYIKTETEVMEVAVETPMLTASLGFKNDEVDTGKDQLSTGRRPNRRGQWGDLWYSGE